MEYTSRDAIVDGLWVVLIGVGTYIATSAALKLLIAAMNGASFVLEQLAR